MLTLEEAIQKRTSTRTFTDETPAAAIIDEVCRPYSCLRPLDAGVVGNGKVGTYGVIKGRPAYVAVIAGDEFRAGLEGERAVIEFTRRGLGTCWLGGTFNSRLAGKAVSVAAGERIVAVIAVGHPAPRRRVLESVMRLAVRSSSRKAVPSLIIAGVPAPQLARAMEAVSLAPSACNRQPWRFAFNTSGHIDVYGDPSDSFVKLDVGIAVAHFLMVRPDYRLAPSPGNHPKLTAITTLLPPDV